MTTTRNVMPIVGILSGALVWGLIWYPYRILQETGLNGIFSAVISYVCALLCGTFMLPRTRFSFKSTDWWTIGLVLSAGWSNLGYVLALLHGEVMRVLLLFYLAPLWTILFSFWLLGEKLNRYGFIVVVVSLSGAMIMLWKPQLGFPLPQNVSEWIGLSAGVSFAFSNVVSRRAAHLNIESKSYSILLGTAILSIPFLLWQGELSNQWQMLDARTWLILGLLGITLCATSFAVQYGVSNLPANQAMLLFLFELVVAAITSYFLAGEAMLTREWIGATFIVSASLLSGRIHTESAI